MPKYHINNNGKPAICKAQHQCPLTDENGQPQQHFDNAKDAQKYYEQQMAENYGVITSISLKDASSNDSSIDKKDNNKILSLVNGIKDSNITPEQAIEIGSIIITSIRNNLSFDINNIKESDITPSQWNEITSKTLSTINAISPIGDTMKNELSGNKSIQKILKQETEIIPNSIKNKLNKHHIVCEKVRKNNAQDWSGYYKGWGMRQIASTAELPQSHKDLPAGEYFSTHISPFSVREQFSTQVIVSMGNGKGKVMHVSNNDFMKPRSNKNFLYKRKNNQNLTINTPYGGAVELNGVTIYEQAEKIRDHSISTIAGPDYLSSPDNPNMGVRAIYLHEYTHFAEARIPEFKYSNVKAMYDKIKNSNNVSINDADKTSPFPSDYMGEANGGEFLTRASEYLFVPERSNKMFGSDRHPNADKVLAWTAGIWATSAINAGR